MTNEFLAYLCEEALEYMWMPCTAWIVCLLMATFLIILLANIDGIWREERLALSIVLAVAFSSFFAGVFCYDFFDVSFHPEFHTLKKTNWLEERGIEKEWESYGR